MVEVKLTKKDKTFNFALIGCGLIGKKRVNALPDNANLISCYDQNHSVANKLVSSIKGKFPRAVVHSSLEDLLSNNELDAVIVATSHDSLTSLGAEVLHSRKHLFLEKPGARHSSELLVLRELSRSFNKTVRVGFNHRFHRSTQKAKNLIDDGAIGNLMHVRARYGHGGRIGYESEWRANPKISGGGELLDQGSHLIDLTQWYMGKIIDIKGTVKTSFWKMAVDDNAFMLLETAQQQTAFLHASCTEWKNMFSMEIFGKIGKIDLSGLGGSYGTEKVTCYFMPPEMGPPYSKTWEFHMVDNSWATELQYFCDDIESGSSNCVSLEETIDTLRIIENLYEASGYDFSS